MMKRFSLRIFLVLILAVALTACRTPGRVYDQREASNVCELHHTTMRSVRVPLGIGSVLPYAGYLEARDKLFPHSYPQWLGSQKDYCIIYVCDDCIRAEDAWRKTLSQK